MKLNSVHRGHVTKHLSTLCLLQVITLTLMDLVQLCFVCKRYFVEVKSAVWAVYQSYVLSAAELAWDQTRDSAHSTQPTWFSWSGFLHLRRFLEGGDQIFPNTSSLVCLFKFNLRKPSLHSQGGFLPNVECVSKEVWLNETTKIQKCLQKLFNNHIDVVTLCRIEIPTHHALLKETNNIFRLKSHHIIIVSRHGTAGPTSCY